MVGKRQLNKLKQIEKNKNMLALCAATVNNSEELQNIESAATVNNSEELQNIESASNLGESNVELIVDKKGTLKENIREWFLKYRPSVASTSALLHILNDVYSDIPLSVETLVGKNQMCIQRTVTPGSYVHIGIERNLLKIVDIIESQNIKEIILDIGIDGLPLFKSSAVGLWPILGRIVNMPMIKVFLIGSYVGVQKPNDIDVFLHDFVTEVKNLIENGFQFQTFNIKFKIRAFLCDAPARSFVCAVKGHNSFNGCTKCEQKGTSILRVTTFSTSIRKPRSDEDFAQRIDQNFHQNKQKLREIEEDINDDTKFAMVATIRSILTPGGLNKNLINLLHIKMMLQFNVDGKQEKKRLLDFPKFVNAIYKALIADGLSKTIFLNDLRTAFRLSKNRYYKKKSVNKQSKKNYTFFNIDSESDAENISPEVEPQTSKTTTPENRSSEITAKTLTLEQF